ncbi:MAG: helix-turn-helix domain-containing protein [bacterium]|nr:helix-turn-helix domain-containing protein [bacterium]
MLPASLSMNGLPVGIALAVRAEAFSASLAARSWSIRQKAERRAHLLLLQSDRGRASWQGTEVALEAGTLLWLPGNVDATVEVGAGAQGFLLSIDDDLLIKIVAGNAEALHLRRTTERVALISGEALPPHLDAIDGSCRAVVAELRTPGFGAATLISSHLLLLCLQLWRLSVTHEEREEISVRGGPALVGNFLQMVELHYRDGWAVARYADALGVTSDKLHAHCQREKNCGPRAIIHERLLREACARLQQLDLPVEQIGYGLGFRDPAYFNRFFRKYQGASPGNYRRQIRLEHARSGPSYAAWP